MKKEQDIPECVLEAPGLASMCISGDATVGLGVEAFNDSGS